MVMEPNDSDESAQRLRDSPNLLAGIIGSAMDAIIAIDDSQRIILFNAAAEKIFACPANEAIGSSVERFIPQRFRDGHSTRVRRFAESGATNRTLHGLGTLWGLRANGQEFPIEASISKVESGGKRFFTAVIRDITERHCAEEAVRESEQRFRLVADTAPVLMWMSGTDKLCTYFNKYWLDFTGRSIEEELGNGWVEGIHPDDLERCLDTYKRSFDRREGFRMEYRLRRHDGQYRWILVIGVPRFNQDGSFAGYIGSCIDVTERMKAEHRLREYEAAVEGAEDIIGVVDREYRLILANRQYLKMRNMTGEQFVGRLASEILGKEVFETVIKPKLDECFRGNVVRFEMRFSYPTVGDRDLLLSYFPIEAANGTIDRVACILHDITDRKRAEEALLETNRTLEAQGSLLRSREELLRVFVKNVPAAVAMLDRDMRYLQVSDRWCSDNSLEASELLGRSREELPEMPERWKEANRRALQGETLRADEDRFESGGSTRWNRWEVRPWKTPEGAVGGILIFVEDITRRKQMEEALSDLSRKLIESQEQERARIGRELHDDINQRLAVLAIEFDRLRGRNDLPGEVQSYMLEL